MKINIIFNNKKCCEFYMLFQVLYKRMLINSNKNVFLRFLIDCLTNKSNYQNSLF